MTSLRNTSTCVREALKIGLLWSRQIDIFFIAFGSAYWGIVGPAFPALGPRRTAAAGEWKEEKLGEGGCACRSPDSEAGYDVVRSPLGGRPSGGLHMTNGVPYV